MGGRKRPATLKKSSGVRPKAPAISRTSPVGVYASVFVALVSALLYVFGSLLLGIHGDVHEDEVTARTSCYHSEKQWKRYQNSIHSAVATAQSQKVESIITSACKDCGDNCTQKLVSFRSKESLLHTVITKQFVVMSQGLPAGSGRSEVAVVQENDKIFDTLLPYSDATRCDIVTCIHYRLWNFVNLLIDQMKDKDLLACLKTKDVYHEHVLHVVSKSKAAGFAKYFLRREERRLQAAGDASAENDFNARLRLNTSKVLLGEKRSFSSPFSYKELDEVAGNDDLKDLLVVGTRLGLSLGRAAHLGWINSPNTDGESPLMITCRVGRAASTKLLLNYGADPFMKGKVWNGTCAHLAAGRQHFDVLKVLFGPGGAGVTPATAALLSKTDRFGRTPMDLTCTYGMTQPSLYLIDKMVSLGHDQMSLAKRCESVYREYSVTTTPSATLGNKESWGIKYRKNDDFDSTDEAKSHAVPTVLKRYMTTDKFIEKYFSRNMPVVITGLGSSWRATKKWRKTKFLKRFGNQLVSASVVPYGKTYGKQSFRTTLRQFVNEYLGKDYIAMKSVKTPEAARGKDDLETVPRYIFDPGYLMRKPFLGDVLTPKFLSPLTKRTQLNQFAIGPRGSGSQPHFHGKAWNALVHGRKRWLLQPPPHGTFSRSTAIEHFSDFVSSTSTAEKGVHDVIQEAGQVLFVPEFWSHATLVLENSLAVAMEFE